MAQILDAAFEPDPTRIEVHMQVMTLRVIFEAHSHPRRTGGHRHCVMRLKKRRAFVDAQVRLHLLAQRFCDECHENAMHCAGSHQLGTTARCLFAWTEAALKRRRHGVSGRFILCDSP